MNEKKAKEIISKCEQMEAWSKQIQSYSTSVKAEMIAFLGGVGTVQRKRNKKSEDLDAQIRAKFFKR
ncbi:hypothetical protein SAMN05421866_0025 [Chryseobacterium oranimense]|uniref:Uncharacterized protein n=1 Tax=Chryseobacterium oranimense TaxID=421058 RepID=A0A1M5X7F5_9FLAO|nr:hypothetical protein [Chryseobacterium oranimense]SHH95729.1 hypothetical protein SAMN05421866_0025 [Chryseobacterium oranimense]